MPQPARFGAAAASEPSRGMVWTVLLSAASMVIAPYVLRGYTVGHDTGFHMSWWLEMADLFRQGIIHARWAPLAYYGYGEAAFVFYPPLSLYAGGLLTLLLPFRLALGAYVWLVALASGFSFFHLCRHFFSPRAALAGAVAYVLNPYFLLEVHARCSLAELLVSALLPIFLLAALSARRAEHARNRSGRVALCRYRTQQRSTHGDISLCRGGLHARADAGATAGHPVVRQARCSHRSGRGISRIFPASRRNRKGLGSCLSTSDRAARCAVGSAGASQGPLRMGARKR